MGTEQNIFPIINDPGVNLATGTLYWSFWQYSGTEAHCQHEMPKYRIESLLINIGVINTTITLYLRVNGVSTSLGTITTAGSHELSPASPVDIAEDDLVNLMITKSGGGGSLYRPLTGGLKYGNA